MAAGFRNNSDIIKGSILMVFIDDNPVAFATSHSLSFTTNTTEVSTKDHGLYPAVIANSQTWEVTTENLACAENINQLFTVLNNAKDNTTVMLKFAKPASYNENGIVGEGNGTSNWTVGDILAEGNALLTSLQLNAPSGDNATLSATFTGVGAFTLDQAGKSISGAAAGGATGITGPTGESGDNTYES